MQMLVLSRYNFYEFGRFLTDSNNPVGAPKFLYTELQLDLQEFLLRLEENPFLPPPIPGLYPAILRDAISELMNVSYMENKGLSLNSFMDSIPYKLIRQGFMFASAEAVKFFPMPPLRRSRSGAFTSPRRCERRMAPADSFLPADSTDSFQTPLTCSLFCIAYSRECAAMTKRVLPLLIFMLLVPCLPLSSEEAFTISTSYQNLLSNSRGTGMLDTILTEALRRTGRQAEIVYTPTDRSLADVNAGIYDAEINRIAGMEDRYPNLRRVPEPTMIMQFVAFAKRPFPIRGWESIRNLDLGIVRGWVILEDATRDFPYVVLVPTEKELFTMLDRGRIDIALYARRTGYAALKDLGIQGAAHLEPPLAEREMYLYVHKRHEAIVEEIARALKEMKRDGTWDALAAVAERH